MDYMACAGKGKVRGNALLLFLRLNPIGEMHANEGDGEDKAENRCYGRDDQDDTLVMVAG